MNEGRCTAKIAVEETTLQFDDLFDYLIPDELSSTAKVGCRVLVPFGKANRKRQGIIVETVMSTSTSKLKNVFSVIDSQPLLSTELVLMIKYISKQYFCTYYSAFKAMIPTGVLIKVTKNMLPIKILLI